MKDLPPPSPLPSGKTIPKDGVYGFFYHWTWICDILYVRFAACCTQERHKLSRKRSEEIMFRQQKCTRRARDVKSIVSMPQIQVLLIWCARAIGRYAHETLSDCARPVFNQGNKTLCLTQQMSPILVPQERHTSPGNTLHGSTLKFT